MGESNCMRNSQINCPLNFRQFHETMAEEMPKQFSNKLLKQFSKENYCNIIFFSRITELCINLNWLFQIKRYILIISRLLQTLSPYVCLRGKASKSRWYIPYFAHCTSPPLSTPTERNEGIDEPLRTMRKIIESQNQTAFLSFGWMMKVLLVLTKRISEPPPAANGWIPFSLVFALYRGTERCWWKSWEHVSRGEIDLIGGDFTSRVGALASSVLWRWLMLSLNHESI